MEKIVITTKGPLPRVVNRFTPMFENARGGPYKYGRPLAFNQAVCDRIKEL